MCGIAGVFGTSAPEIVSRMLRVMAHRGPDDQHVVHGDGYTLGARRLSIIDLDHGRQPLSCDNGRIWAAQNGEIYNFQERRDALEKGGHVFATRSDTEVLPHLYQVHGFDFPKQLEGMFAVCLWDETNQTGMLVRDRSGKKPLYYTQREGCLWFASEIKALLQIPGLPRRLNLEALHYYLSYKNVPAPLTIFQGISMLQPAHRLLWKDGQVTAHNRYWKLDWTPFEGDPSEQELADELLERLAAGVKRRLVSDVPIGFFLSGGVDSSLSTALAAEASPNQIKTFTLKYTADSSTPGKELDLKCAREIAQRYDTDHHEELMDFSHFKEELPAVLSHFDEPFSGVISTYFLSRLISKHVKVALSGDGADELFGSYLSHRLAKPLADYWQAHQAGTEPTDLGHFADQPDFLERLAAPHDWLWRYKLLVFNDEDKSRLYSRAVIDEMHGYSTLNHLKRTFANLTAGDPTNRILEAEFETQLPDQVLAFVDRLSMAHSLEIRTGFLDTAVMEFAARVPGKYKIHGTEVKSVLKRAARKHLPASAIDRPKEGFVMPVNQWLNSWLFDYAREALAPARLEAHGLFSAIEVDSLLTRFKAGEQNLANKVLSLLCFQIWYQIYMEQVLPLPLGDAAKLVVSESKNGQLKSVEIGSVSVLVPGEGAAKPALA
ncbi:MAG: asparagine synthase (glutamine-hydrolyzing) [Vulcanimicrobiota bacterium]